MNMTDSITIVSGLPRSGTSMMMNMLEAGGMDVVVDNEREADEDNPKGYFELEAVKKIKENNSWLSDAEGNVVKMVSMLLYELPVDRKYKVIFMKRNMDEMLLSQQKMLERKNEKNIATNEELKNLYNTHLNDIHRWLQEQEHIEVLYVSYNDILDNPHESIQGINLFLDNQLDCQKMMQVVDQSLYRNRSAEIGAAKQNLEDPSNTAEKEEDSEKVMAQLKNLGYM